MDLRETSGFQLVVIDAFVLVFSLFHTYSSHAWKSFDSAFYLFHQDGLAHFGAVLSVIVANVLYLAADSITANMLISGDLEPSSRQAAEIASFADGLVLLALGFLLAICSGKRIERLIGTRPFLDPWWGFAFVGIGIATFVVNTAITFALYSANNDNSVIKNRAIAGLYSTVILLFEGFGLAWMLLYLRNALGRARYRLSLAASVIAAGSTPQGLTPYPMSNTSYLLGVQGLSSMFCLGSALLLMILLRSIMFLAIYIDVVADTGRIQNSPSAHGVLNSIGDLANLLIVILVVLITFPPRDDVVMEVVRQANLVDILPTPSNRSPHHVLPETPLERSISFNLDRTLAGRNAEKAPKPRLDTSTDIKLPHSDEYNRSPRSADRLVSLHGKDEINVPTGGAVSAAPADTEFKAIPEIPRTRLSFDQLVSRKLSYDLEEPRISNVTATGTHNSSRPLSSAAGKPSHKRQGQFGITSLPDIPEVSPRSSHFQISHGRAVSDISIGAVDSKVNIKYASMQSSSDFRLSLLAGRADVFTPTESHKSEAHTLGSLYLELPNTKGAIYDTIASQTGFADGNGNKSDGEVKSKSARSSLNPFAPPSRVSTNPFAQYSRSGDYYMARLSLNDGKDSTLLPILPDPSEFRSSDYGGYLFDTGRHSANTNRRSAQSEWSSSTGRDWLREFSQRGFDDNLYNTTNLDPMISQRTSLKSRTSRNSATSSRRRTLMDPASLLFHDSELFRSSPIDLGLFEKFGHSTPSVTSANSGANWPMTRSNSFARIESAVPTTGVNLSFFNKPLPPVPASPTEPSLGLTANEKRADAVNRELNFVSLRILQPGVATPMVETASRSPARPTQKLDVVEVTELTQKQQRRLGEDKVASQWSQEAGGMGNAASVAQGPELIRKDSRAAMHRRGTIEPPKHGSDSSNNHISAALTMGKSDTTSRFKPSSPFTRDAQDSSSETKTLNSDNGSSSGTGSTVILNVIQRNLLNDHGGNSGGTPQGQQLVQQLVESHSDCDSDVINQSVWLESGCSSRASKIERDNSPPISQGHTNHQRLRSTKGKEPATVFSADGVSMRMRPSLADRQQIKGTASRSGVNMKSNLQERRKVQGNLQVSTFGSSSQVDREVVATSSNNYSNAAVKGGASQSRPIQKVAAEIISPPSVPFSPYLQETLTPVIGCDPAALLAAKRKSRASNRPQSVDESSQPGSPAFLFTIHSPAASPNMVWHASKRFNIISTDNTGTDVSQKDPCIVTLGGSRKTAMGHFRSATVSQLDQFDEADLEEDSANYEGKALTDALIEHFPAISTPATASRPRSKDSSPIRPSSK